MDLLIGESQIPHLGVISKNFYDDTSMFDQLLCYLMNSGQVSNSYHLLINVYVLLSALDLNVEQVFLHHFLKRPFDQCVLDYDMLPVAIYKKQEFPYCSENENKLFDVSAYGG